MKNGSVKHSSARKRRLVIGISVLVLIGVVGFLLIRLLRAPKLPATAETAAGTSAVEKGAAQRSDDTSTRIYAHNLMLRKGPSFRIYVRWLRGEMARTHRAVNPSFDDPESFVLDIKTGVLRANIGDIANFLNTPGAIQSPLKNISLTGDGEQVKLKGTLHKLVPLPVELDGTISVASGNRIQLHVSKINVLKIPLKGLLGSFSVQLSDLFNGKNLPGVEIVGNDVFFDTQKLLPPPHIRGELTRVRVVNPDLEEVFGDAKEDVERVEQWRNFLRLRGGTLDLGKLTMHHVDIIMIDISNKAWFDLDLTHYQEQLVNGYTRMTLQAGLQIFMPDLSELPKNKSTKSISIEWLKNRNLPPPADVRKK